MAMAKVEIISKEMIKPSLPTSHTLRTHKLSRLDQTVPPIFIPLIFLYQFEKLHNIVDHARKVQLLKQSLSDALTRFYPLAGRLNDNHSIDCNDVGAEFIEAQVHGHLSQVVENPKIEELRVLLPIEDRDTDNIDVILAIKVNLFDCGGIAIGVCMSHKVGDGLSIVTFINAWASTARGDNDNIVQPNFSSASLFPPIDLLNSFRSSVGLRNEKLLVRKFIFNKEKLDALKRSAFPGSQVKDPTRVEALSAFILKHFIGEYLKKSTIDSKNKILTLHMVNIRPRMNPPLSDNFFGNLWTSALALSNLESENGTNDLVYELRNAIRKVDSDYIKILQKGEDFMKYLGAALERLSNGETDFCYFTSWCRFPVYEVDFGWGRPTRVCTTTMPYKNCIILMSTKCGEGIEAYVSMLKEDGFSKALA